MVFLKNKEILIDLLSAILNCEITDIEIYNDSALGKNGEKDKYGILNIKAVIDNNKVVNVEMQISNNYDILKRMLFYSSSLYISSIKEGESYKKLKQIGMNLAQIEEILELTKEEIEKNKKRNNI